jgi:hypothetical protein
VVSKACNTPCSESSPIDRWLFKIKTLRRIVRDWATNEVATLNKIKATLAEEYNRLDEEAEVEGLRSQGLKRLKEVADELGKIWALEGIKIRQSSRHRDLWKGTGTQHIFKP